MQSGIFHPLRVAVIGTGYVGLTTGVSLAFLGHRIVAVDKDINKVEMLKNGKSPIHEYGLDELLMQTREHVHFSGDTAGSVGEADVILIAVGTPSRENGQADTQYVEAAAREIAEGLLPERKYTIIVKSTVPVGSNRRVQHVIHETLLAQDVSGRISVNVASNPEFLREGTALHDTLYPDRIVVGAETSESVDVIRQLYQPILEQTFAEPAALPRPEGYDLPSMVTTDPISAELIKYASNAFLAMKISYANEIAGLCERVGGNITEVTRGMGLDSRISPDFLRAGLGWGGSCFPKDTAALVAMGKELACPMRLVEASREVNTAQRQRVVERLQEELKGLRGRVVGVLGLSFKPGTDDLRESPAVEVVRALLEREAHVRVHDPIAMDNARIELEGSGVEFFANPDDLAPGADALVLATEWPEYRALKLERLSAAMRTPILVDARNLFDRDQAISANLTYLAVGR
ncbi:UDP-glucose dehydrogenase family protein [Candidatus Bipolaricaulota bacterium]